MTPAMVVLMDTVVLTGSWCRLILSTHWGSSLAPLRSIVSKLRLWVLSQPAMLDEAGIHTTEFVDWSNGVPGLPPS